MHGKAAGSPAYWRYAGDRERSQAPAGPGKRKETLDARHWPGGEPVRSSIAAAVPADWRRSKTSRTAIERAVQELLGHAKPETSRRYTQLSDGKLADAVNAI